MYLFRLCFLIVVFCFLSACGTMKAVSESNQDQNQKIKTAKINAQLGIAYLERNDIIRAKRKLLMSLDQAPSIPEPWYSMGYFLEATGSKTEAEKYYIKAIEVAPTSGDAQNNYGTYLCRVGNYNEAIQHFLTAIKSPKYMNVGDAYENAGLCALKIPNYKQAAEYFNLALMQDPNRATSLIEMAELNYKKGNYVEANEKLNQFLLVSAPTEQSNLLGASLDKKMGGQTRKIAIKPKTVEINDSDQVLALLKKRETESANAAKESKTIAANANQKGNATANTQKKIDDMVLATEKNKQNAAESWTFQAATKATEILI